LSLPVPRPLPLPLPASSTEAEAEAAEGGPVVGLLAAVEPEAKALLLD